MSMLDPPGSPSFRDTPGFWEVMLEALHNAKFGNTNIQVIQATNTH